MERCENPSPFILDPVSRLTFTPPVGAKRRSRSAGPREIVTPLNRVHPVKCPLFPISPGHPSGCSTGVKSTPVTAKFIPLNLSDFLFNWDVFH